MTSKEIQHNNPLHGLKLETLLNEIVDYYGWEILADAININCFKQSPSIASSLKFLRKTQWAQEKVEAFYLYQLKGLPKADDEQYELPPRQRSIPLDQKPRKPEEIWVGKYAEKRARKASRPYHGDKNKRDKSAYSSNFPAPDKSSSTKSYDNKPYAPKPNNNKAGDNQSTSETPKNGSGFVNPWTDEHY